MHIKMRALVKAVASKDWQGKHYDSIELFGGGGEDGQPADFSVGVDMSTQRAMFAQAEQLRQKMVDMIVDMSFYERRANFRLVSLQGAAQAVSSK